MEYILYHIIYGAVAMVDDINEMDEEGAFDELYDDPFFVGIEDEEYSTIDQVPEPDRSIVLDAVAEEIEGEFQTEDNVNPEVDNVMATLQEKYDIKINLGIITYYPDRFSARLEVKNGRNAYQTASSDFDANVWKFEDIGFQKGMYMRVCWRRCSSI